MFHRTRIRSEIIILLGTSRLLHIKSLKRKHILCGVAILAKLQYETGSKRQTIILPKEHGRRGGGSDGPEAAIVSQYNTRTHCKSESQSAESVTSRYTTPIHSNLLHLQLPCVASCCCCCCCLQSAMFVIVNCTEIHVACVVCHKESCR